MKKSFALALVLAVGVVFTSVTLARRSDSYQFADRDGVWTVKTSDQSMTAIRLLPAQRQVVVQKRDAIFDVIRASKVLNPLKGNDIDAEKSVVARANDEGHYPTTGPVVMMVQLWFRHFFKEEKTGRVVRATVGMTPLNFVTNDLAAVAWWGPNRLYGGLRDERGHSVFLDPRVSTTIAGRTSYRMLEWGEVVVLPDYFDPSLPRTAVQLIACEFDFLGAHDADEPGPAYSSMVRLFWQFEYDKLAGLIEGARASR